MPRPSIRLVVAIACCMTVMPARAITVTRIVVEGLDDEAMARNVRSALSLQDAQGKALHARRLNHLLRIAGDEARRALEPFGYYDPIITITRSDRSGNVNDDTTAGEARDDKASHDSDSDDQDAVTDTRQGTTQDRRDRAVTVTLRITPGTPVRIRGFDVGVDGPGAADAGVVAALDGFHPRAGEILDHARYEAGKAQVGAALARHGYFDASLATHRVEVTRADHAADLALRWTSGDRHALGEARFTQIPSAPIRPRLLEKLVPWTPGVPYDEAALERLRASLVALDYFGLVDVQAVPAEAAGGRVPVDVQLTPAKRSIYSWGASYGTASGAGISAGVERRYLNSRGHKALAQLDWAEKRKAATLQYRIPAFAWRDGWYAVSLQAADEQNTYIDSRRLELVASRTGQYSPRLALSASMHVLRERWAYVSLVEPVSVPVFQYASFAFPALRAEYVAVDDRLAPRRGGGATLTVRGGRGGADGNATFTQVQVGAQWFRGLGADSRLIARGELGHTFTRDVLDLPPSLRFYAGGDRSVRGYGWHEIGPRIATGGGDYFTGAPNVITASLEYERYVRGPWGVATFIDTGDAFTGRRATLHTGVGIGLRWRSPVGPVRIDVARGLDSPDSPITLHLNIGADL